MKNLHNLPKNCHAEFISASKIPILCIVFLTPLIGPWLGLGYEQAKVLFFIVSISLIGIVWASSKPKIKWTKLKLGGLGWLGILGVASIFGIDPKTSFLGSYPYFQGFILYVYLFVFFLMVSSLPIKIESWAKVLTFSALIVSVFAILNFIQLSFFHIHVPTYAGRVVSTFGQPNFYAGFLLLVLPLLGGLGSAAWRIGKTCLPAGRLGGLGIITAILISQSRAAVALMFLVLVGFLLGKFKMHAWFKGVALLMGLILAGAIFYYQEISVPRETRFDQFADAAGAAEKRYYIWPIVWEIIKEKPVLGYGLENIYPAYNNYFAKNYHQFFEENVKQSSVLIRLKDLGIDRSHNYILDLLMSSGILGLLGWLGIVGMVIWKVKSWPIFTSLMLYLIWAQFQNQGVAHLIFFWLLIGVVDSD